MKRCERCGAPLGLWALASAAAGAVVVFTTIYSSRRSLKDRERIRCGCGACYRPAAPATLALAALVMCAAASWGALRLAAPSLDRHTAAWTPYWQAAAVIAVVVAPSVPVFSILGWVWPVRFDGMDASDPSEVRAKRGTAAAAFYLAAAALYLLVAEQLWLVGGFALLTAAVCAWSERRK